MTKHPAEATDLTLRYLILRYLVAVVLTSILLAVVEFVLGLLFQFQGSAGMGIVAVIVPAMDAGQVFARRNARVPGSTEAWRLSAVLLGANVALSALIVLVLTLLAGEKAPIMEIFRVLATPLGLGLMAGILVIFFLATRFFFGSGARGEMKRQTRVAKKQE